MAQADVRAALEVMQEDGVRAQFEAGDFTAASDLALTEDERLLLQTAAADPDVAGFGMDLSFHLGGGATGLDPTNEAKKNIGNVKYEDVKGPHPEIRK